MVFDESEGREEVFIADDWDRTPSEPSLKLSYSYVSPHPLFVWSCADGGVGIY